MVRNRRPLMILLALAATAVAAQQRQALAPADTSPRAYWNDRWRGWHFYEAPQVDPDPDQHTAPTAPRGPASTPERPVEIIEFERMQKALEETRNIAIMRPTEANVRRYMALEMQVVSRASYFADVAQRVAWATPALDPALHGRPVNATALEVFERQQQTERTSTVAALGRDHVLFFFYRSDCPYCHAFAPILKAFEARHGIQVMAVGLDGGPLPAFPDARQDNGIATALQVSQVPAVFLARPASGTITPIGFGVLSQSQLLERIAVVASPQSQAMLPGTARQLTLP